MTAHEMFAEQRINIVKSLLDAGVATIQFNKDAVPKQLPCGIVILDSETGKNGTSRQFVSTDLAWTVFLIVNAQNEDDPDNDLYLLKEKFRANYQRLMKRDLPSLEYYTSRIDGARLVRIAKIDLLKVGTGASS